jgi:hypothetical protein
MKFIFIIVCVILSFTLPSYGQNNTPSRIIYNSEFKWTISIPIGFDTVSSSEWQRMQNRGAEAIEKTINTEVENHAKTIFVFKSDQFNYFESNVQPYDVNLNGNYLQGFKAVNDMIYGTFESQMKGAKIDSSYSTQMVDGLTFQKFIIVITLPNGVLLKWHMYSRLFDKKEFTVNIMTLDKQKEIELLNSWLNSKFSK